MSRWADAERHFEAALAMNTRIGAHAPLAHTRHDYATMLLARDAAGRPATRRRSVAGQPGCARGFGMRGWKSAPAPRLALLAARRTGAPAAIDDLTSREIEVLRLIAIGRSNADIAMVLAISLNTVATHVRNILAKTGCANRTEAAAYAMRHGLADGAHQAEPRPHHFW